MYAVIQVGSSQYKVTEGDIITTDKVDQQEGGTVDLDKVLMYANEGDVRIGKPFLEDVKVSVTISKHLLDAKKIAFKYRKRKDSSVKKGHRQKLTALNITKIAV